MGSWCDCFEAGRECRNAPIYDYAIHGKVLAQILHRLRLPRTRRAEGVPTAIKELRG